MADLYIGLMSGTSADGIDAVIIEIDQGKVRILNHHSHTYSNQLRTEILRLCQPGKNEIENMGRLDHQLGLAFAETVNELLHNTGLQAKQITATGSHGQTIRHRPPSTEEISFTLQIGDPNIIAEQTGITTVADFRRRDMAAGGEGAPLAPAFHQAVFSHPIETRVIVNIGGIANITTLKGNKMSRGFDTGPGNALMDCWTTLHRGKPYDDQGLWAASGNSDTALFKQLISHPYFNQPPPKSTGREIFHLGWLNQELLNFPGIDPADIQATLLELTAVTIQQAINKETNRCDGIFVCGGGARNSALMQRLEQLCPAPVTSTATLGIDPQQVEAAAFAWLAQQTLNRQPGNARAATGASHDVILGGVYFA